MVLEAGAAAEHVAAVDLGSNSFHMLVARPQGREMVVIDRLRESVRLGAGLDARKRLSPAAAERALDCLERFGQRLRDIPRGRARVVGTNTLRRMRGGQDFLAAAGRALGHPVEVISGVEEARLIYGGVIHGMGDEQPNRLVIDIGGGSTEAIIGELARPRLLESLRMGCVSHTQTHFADGKITAKRFGRARLAARVELEWMEQPYRDTGWDVCIGASGTVRAIAKVIAAQGWGEGGITPDTLEQCIQLVVDAGHIDKLTFDGLREDRQPIFAGGLAVLAGLFDGLGIARMEVSDRALREGVIYDLLGRLSDRDAREAAVLGLKLRFQVDEAHARRVRDTGLGLLRGIAEGWGLDDPDCFRLMVWAAELHEVGISIAHASYHKHGEYLLRHADLEGFSQTNQRLLAALVRLHRGKFRTATLDDLPEAWRERIRRLSMLLRLAVIFHRGRGQEPAPSVSLAADGDALCLQFEAGWLDQHPLTRADLEREQTVLKAGGAVLRLDG